MSVISLAACSRESPMQRECRDEYVDLVACGQVLFKNENTITSMFYYRKVGLMARVYTRALQIQSTIGIGITLFFLQFDVAIIQCAAKCNSDSSSQGRESSNCFHGPGFAPFNHPCIELVPVHRYVAPIVCGVDESQD